MKWKNWIRRSLPCRLQNLTMITMMMYFPQSYLCSQNLFLTLKHLFCSVTASSSSDVIITSHFFLLFLRLSLAQISLVLINGLRTSWWEGKRRGERMREGIVLKLPGDTGATRTKDTWDSVPHTLQKVQPSKLSPVLKIKKLALLGFSAHGVHVGTLAGSLSLSIPPACRTQPRTLSFQIEQPGLFKWSPEASVSFLQNSIPMRT